MFPDMTKLISIMARAAQSQIVGKNEKQIWFYYFMCCRMLHFQILRSSKNRYAFNIKTQRKTLWIPRIDTNLNNINIIPFSRIIQQPNISYKDPQKNELLHIIFKLYYYGLIYNFGISHIGQEISIYNQKKKFNFYIICEYNSLKFIYEHSGRNKIWTLFYKNHYSHNGKNSIILNWKEIFKCLQYLNNLNISYYQIIFSIQKKIKSELYSFLLDHFSFDPIARKIHHKETFKLKRILFRGQFCKKGYHFLDQYKRLTH